MKKCCLIVVLTLASITWLSSCSQDGTSPSSTFLSDQRVVFVGASITEAWDFSQYFPGYDFRKVIYFDWDKTQVWDQVADLHPDIVLVKECAAYFYAEGGTPIQEYENCMIQMATYSHNIGAFPVLATTLPIDVGYGGCTQLQLNDIRAFNDWVRNFCWSHDIPCMDYYNQIADSEGQLPTNYHDGDGLHPNNAGYDDLSQIVIPVLENAVPDPPPL